MENMKTYLLDTNVLIQDPDSIFKFEDNEVVISDIVIEELDKLKKKPGDLGYNARSAIRKIEALRTQGDILKGINLEDHGIFRIEVNYKSIPLPDCWDNSSPDNGIIKVAKGLSDNGNHVILVSKDAVMRIKATAMGIIAEDYENEAVDEEYLSYNGRAVLDVTNEIIQEFYNKGYLSYPDNKMNLIENQFVLLRAQSTAIGRYTNGRIVPLEHLNDHPFGITFRNNGQRFAGEALLSDPDVAPLVILKGPAGTAKTFLSLACGLDSVIESKDYRRMIITRANVAFDNDIGSLPGDEVSKVSPLMRGCLDNIELLTDEKTVKGKGDESELNYKVNYLFDIGAIDIQALGYLRGRSITKQILLIDEAQNTTPNQMLGILTRAGEGTKVIICGDLDQIDNTRLDRHTNGLAFALKTMVGSPLCWTVGFTNEETTRSKLAAEAAERMTKHQ